MLTYVLDTSAVIRFLDGEAGAQQVKGVFQAADDRECRIVISAVNWGELVYTLVRRQGPHTAVHIELRLRRHTFQIESATAERCAQAGLLKLKYKISYADAFGLELAANSPNHILMTADYGVKSAENDIRIEFLPPKTKL